MFAFVATGRQSVGRDATQAVAIVGASAVLGLGKTKTGMDDSENDFVPTRYNRICILRAVDALKEMRI